MKILDALLSPKREVTRYSFDQWVSEYFQFGGSQYPLGLQTTYGSEKAEPIASDFTGYVQGALEACSAVAAVEAVRVDIFSEALFKYQRLRNGRPGDMWGDASLEVLEKPWEGATTGDLLTRMILDADMAGNFYGAEVDGEIVRLRPDWVEIVLAPRELDRGPEGETVTVGMRRIGYFYYEGGIVPNKTPAVFFPDEVAHFAPRPDPLATFRGRSWLTPVINEVKADKQATKHKLKFFENAATPNVAVSLAKEITPEQFNAFVDKMDEKHKGADNAYKTLYTGGGADVTVIGQNMQQLDFKVTQGAGETRIAAAAGVHPVIAALSEGMQGSSLNAGNFNSARRLVADRTMRPLWGKAAGALATIVPPPSDSRLWWDGRDIGFLREDEKDGAEIQNKRAQTLRTLLDAGYTPETAVAAVENDDMSLLEHSGLFSVQLQPPGTQQPEEKPEEEGDDE